MYWIIAIVRSSAMDTVREGLRNIGCLGLTCSDVIGFGKQRGHTETYRGAEYQVNLVPKVRLEIACTPGELNFVIDAIRKGSRSGTHGNIGDGKIFVFNLEETVRIRTGQSGTVALE